MDGYITIGTKIDTDDFERQIEHLTTYLKDLEDDYNRISNTKPFEGQTEQLKKMSAEILSVKKKITSLRTEKDKLTQTGFQNIQKQLSGIGSKIENVTSKIARWGIALIGIRSVYGFITSSISTLSQYDEQLAVNISYIRYLLASTLKPVIENLIQLVYKLLAYVNYIAQAWFGINLFANASTKAFEKQNKALGGSVKQAKQLQKTLAGFDEMNILQKNGNVSSGGGGGGINDNTPLPNFPKMKDVKIPSWLKWIKEHKNEIIEGLLGIVGVLTSLKLGLSGIQGLGIGLALIGIYHTIKKIIDFLNEPTFSNFIGILKGIATTVLGIAIAFGAWPVALGSAIALIILMIVEHFDEIKKIFDDFIKWLDTKFLGALRYLFGPLGDILYLPIKYFVELARGAFNGFYGGIKKTIEGVMKIFRGDFLGGIEDIFGGLLSTMTAPLQGFVRAIGKVWDQIKDTLNTLVENINDTLDKINPINIVSNVGSSVGKGIGGAWKKVKNFFGFAKGGIVVPRLASGGIINQPGRGVPLASAIGGERGAEGVIPLTDSQQMSLLGEAIGRYITVNLTNVTELDGRTIARKVSEVNNNTNFLLNR